MRQVRTYRIVPVQTRPSNTPFSTLNQFQPNGSLQVNLFSTSPPFLQLILQAHRFHVSFSLPKISRCVKVQLGTDCTCYEESISQHVHASPRISVVTFQSNKTGQQSDGRQADSLQPFSPILSQTGPVPNPAMQLTLNSRRERI